MGIQVLWNQGTRRLQMRECGSFTSWIQSYTENRMQFPMDLWMA